MRKIAFPKFGKTEKRKKIAFLNLGRLKNSEKWLSQTWENRKMSQAAFPTPWKAKKRRKPHFQPLGRTKNAENHSSLVSEMQKI